MTNLPGHSSLPAHAAVVVIGGGVMGASTLYHLARMGVSDAILLEAHQLTSGTTWHSAAQVRALRHSQNLTRMIRYSIDLYKGLEAETGQATGWIQKGSLSIATTPDRLTHIKRQEALAQAYGVEAHSISKDEALTHWPLMRSDDVIGAVFSPDDGRVSPSDLCAALVKGAKANGAKLYENTAVTGILTKNNRIAGVETSKGVVTCDAVAVCAGLWSRKVAAMANEVAPLYPCEHFYLLTRPVEGITGNLPTLSDHDSHLYIRDDSGGLLVGCFEPLGKPIDPDQLGEDFSFGLLPEDWNHFAPMMELALHRLPALETAEVKMLLNGPESFTPDGAFMLGETAETRGLFLGCGMNSVGVASAGGAGMNLAHAIIHGRMTCDLHELDPMRFAPVFNSLEHLVARVPEVLGTHYEIAYPGRQFASARHLRALPLESAHRSDQAHFGQVFGFERPLYFGKTREPQLSFGKPDWFDSVKSEVMAAHTKAALFDSSSFGKIEISGPDAEAFLLYICAGFVNRPPGSVIYSALLNKTGTFEADVILQRLAETHYRMFSGSASIRRDLAWLRRHAEGYQVEIKDVSKELAVIGLMGPETGRLARELGADDLANIGYFKHSEVTIKGISVRAARLSYVGEAGWELTCASDKVSELYGHLREVGAQPAGLYAQTSMRIEKAFRAMGHELDGDISPIEAGLDRMVRSSGGFIGAEALNLRRKEVNMMKVQSLVFEDETAVPIGHEPVYQAGKIIGQTSSCAFGYRVGKPVALAVLKSADREAQTSVNIAGIFYDVRMVDGPLFPG